jgi:hypothetical protein
VGKTKMATPSKQNQGQPTLANVRAQFGGERLEATTEQRPQSQCAQMERLMCGSDGLQCRLTERMNPM